MPAANISFWVSPVSMMMMMIMIMLMMTMMMTVQNVLSGSPGQDSKTREGSNLRQQKQTLLTSSVRDGNRQTHEVPRLPIIVGKQQGSTTMHLHNAPCGKAQNFPKLEREAILRQQAQTCLTHVPCPLTTRKVTKDRACHVFCACEVAVTQVTARANDCYSHCYCYDGDTRKANPLPTLYVPISPLCPAGFGKYHVPLGFWDLHLTSPFMLLGFRPPTSPFRVLAFSTNISV